MQPFPKRSPHLAKSFSTLLSKPWRNARRSRPSRARKKSQNRPTHFTNFEKCIAATLSRAFIAFPGRELSRFNVRLLSCRPQRIFYPIVRANPARAQNLEKFLSPQPRKSRRPTPGKAAREPTGGGELAPPVSNEWAPERIARVAAAPNFAASTAHIAKTVPAGGKRSAMTGTSALSVAVAVPKQWARSCSDARANTYPRAGPLSIPHTHLSGAMQSRFTTQKTPRITGRDNTA